MNIPTGAGNFFPKRPGMIDMGFLRGELGGMGERVSGPWCSQVFLYVVAVERMAL